jgi:rod shape-determining protein MreD
MIRHRILQLILLSIALMAQVSILPLVIKSVSSVNPLLALLLILALKEDRIESLVWGAFLGGLTDLLLFQHIGYHGISFALIAYVMGLISHKMVIHGVIPLFLLSIPAFLAMFCVTVGLMNLLQGGWDFSVLVLPLLLGILFTPLLTIFFDFLYKRLDRLLLKK